MFFQSLSVDDLEQPTSTSNSQLRVKHIQTHLLGKTVIESSEVTDNEIKKNTTCTRSTSMRSIS